MPKEYTMAERLDQLTEKRAHVHAGGGEGKLQKHRDKEKIGRAHV